MLGVVKKYEKEWIDFTRSIVKIPSITGTEGKLAEFFVSKMKEIGIKDPFIDEAGNVAGIIKGSGKGPNIMLNGHLDTVPSGMAESWAPYSPFEAKIDDGKIYGLGVSDLKAGLAVQFYAFKVIQEAVKQNKITLPGDLIFSAVVNEEPAEMLGMEYFVEKTMPKHNIKVDLVYLSEPTTNYVVIGQRGKVELAVRTFGKTAHSSTPKLGINALQKMLPIMDEIFHNMESKLVTDPVIGESSITITDCVVKPGQKMSIVPDECEISIDRRYMPGEKIEDLLDDFNKIFAELKKKDPEFRATVEPRVFTEKTWTGYEKAVKKYHPPWRTDKNSDFVKKTFSALKSVGQEPKEKYWKFGTDGSMTCSIHGIPTIGYSGAEEKWAHQPKENVEISEMLKSFDGYVAILCEIYGLDSKVFD